MVNMIIDGKSEGYFRIV